MPNLEYEKAKKIVFTPYGMQLSEDCVDPKADTVVVLGGLAMPNIGVNADEMRKLIDRITDGKNRGLLHENLRTIRLHAQRISQHFPQYPWQPLVVWVNGE